MRPLSAFVSILALANAALATPLSDSALALRDNHQPPICTGAGPETLLGPVNPSADALANLQETTRPMYEKLLSDDPNFEAKLRAGLEAYWGKTITNQCSRDALIGAIGHGHGTEGTLQKRGLGSWLVALLLFLLF